MWITPKQDWNPNDLVTAQHMNDIGANLAYLNTKSGRGVANINTSTTNSTSFITLKSLNITTRGGDLLLGFYATITHDSTALHYYDASIDGVRVAINGANGSVEARGTPNPEVASFTLLRQSVSAGAHTIALVWRTNTGNASISVGQFWALEV